VYPKRAAIFKYHDLQNTEVDWAKKTLTFKKYVLKYYKDVLK